MVEKREGNCHSEPVLFDALLSVGLVGDNERGRETARAINSFFGGKGMIETEGNELRLANSTMGDGKLTLVFNPNRLKVTYTRYPATGKPEISRTVNSAMDFCGDLGRGSKEMLLMILKNGDAVALMKKEDKGIMMHRFKGVE